MAHKTLISELQTQYASVVNPLVPDDEPCVIIDFPNHANVGDLAIWSGMKTYLKNRNLAVAYECDTFTYDAKKIRRILGKSGTIIIHGGGNFGDLWQNHETLRENVLRDFPEQRIVQFPQSIHFENPEHAEKVRLLIKDAKNFTLLVRDRKSYDFARNTLGAKTFLCPDSAFMLGSVARPVEPSANIIWLARTDKESKNRPLQEADVSVVDWLHPPFDLRFVFCYGASRAAGICNSMGLPWIGSILGTLSSGLYDVVAPLHIKRGLRLLSRGKIVVTDRLHGHILCLLLGIQHVILDNNYGKVTDFYKQWTVTSDITRYASSSEEAMRIAREMLAQPN